MEEQKQSLPKHGLGEPDQWGYVTVEVAGHNKVLRAHPGSSMCGDIEDGVVFKFEGEGGWVIDLATLRALVAEADRIRAAASIGEQQ